MSNERRRSGGMTLIELIIALVIVSVGLAGVLVAFSQVVRASADGMIHKQMQAIAEGISDEIGQQAFVAAPNAPAATCGRDTWNDMLDYQGYDTATTTCLAGGPATAGAIYTLDGTAVAALAGYSVRVDIADTTLPPAPQANGIAPPNARRVTVTVRHGGDAFQLISWRTAY